METSYWLLVFSSKQWEDMRTSPELLSNGDLGAMSSGRYGIGDQLISFLIDEKRFVGSLSVVLEKGNQAYKFDYNLASKRGAKLDRFIKEIPLFKKETGHEDWQKLVEEAPSILSEKDGKIIIRELKIARYQAKYLDDPDMLATYYC